MSEYLNRPARTEEEALADIRKTQAKALLAVTNTVIRLTKQMKEVAKWLSD